MAKALTFRMLTTEEKQKYIEYANSWKNTKLWSDAKKAERYEGKAAVY